MDCPYPDTGSFRAVGIPFACPLPFRPSPVYRNFSAAWCLNASVGGGQLAQMNYHLLAVNLVTLMVDTSAALWLAALLMLPYCLLFAGSA